MHDTTRRSEEPERIPPTAGDYFIIQNREQWFYVSTVMAAAIETRLARRFPPKWISFVDLTGARVSLRRDQIVGVIQSTAAQRAEGRTFEANRHQEDRADRDWDLF